MEGRLFPCARDVDGLIDGTNLAQLGRFAPRNGTGIGPLTVTVLTVAGRQSRWAAATTELHFYTLSNDRWIAADSEPGQNGLTGSGAGL